MPYCGITLLLQPNLHTVYCSLDSPWQLSLTSYTCLFSLMLRRKWLKSSFNNRYSLFSLLYCAKPFYIVYFFFRPWDIQDDQDNIWLWQFFSALRGMCDLKNYHWKFALQRGYFNTDKEGKNLFFLDVGVVVDFTQKRVAQQREPGRCSNRKEQPKRRRHTG